MPRQEGHGGGYRLRLHVPRRGRPHVRRRGQSLVELALVAPILVVMLVGAAQVGAIAFGLVSIDSAAREGARAGALAPNNSLKSGGVTWWSSSTTGPQTHKCNQADFTAGTTVNPICQAVLESSGTLSAGLFTTSPCSTSLQACVTITVLPGAAYLNSMETRPQRVRLEASSCNGAWATVTGAVSGIPSGQTAIITDLTNDSQPTDTSGNFSICVKTNTSTQSLTAQVGTASCGGYSGTTGTFDVVSGSAYTKNFAVGFEGTCPTQTPAPPPTPTPTPAPCTSNQATVTGLVTGMPLGQSANIKSATSGETTSTNADTSYFICVASNGSNKNQVLTAQDGNPLCGGFYGSLSLTVTNGGVFPNENIPVTAEPNCPPPTPPPTVVTTCASETVPPSTATPAPYYIRVTVTYPVQIFVPFIGAIFQTQPGFRVISTTVTDAIEPCDLTGGL